MHTAKLSASLLVTLAFVLGPGPAPAETVDCTAITSLPATITAAGVYCLTANLATSSTSGRAIEIQASNVVLDLNGFNLSGLGAGAGTGAVGIYANARQNLTIKNGTVRGFIRGIELWDDANVSQGHIVEDIRADQNTYIGMTVRGTGTIVRNNQVVATGGTTTLGSNANAIGIYILGTGPRLLNNDVVNTVKQGSGTAWGILFDTVASGLAVNNRITGADRGIEYSSSTGKYRDTLTSGVTTPFTSGTSAGNND